MRNGRLMAGRAMLGLIVLVPVSQCVAQNGQSQPTPKRVRVNAGVLRPTKSMAPRYPEDARRAHVTGSVVMAVTIGKDGRIEKLQLISGHPMLSQAAMDAVRQWRYKPLTVHGEAVEVETEITVNFILGQR